MSTSSSADWTTIAQNLREELIAESNRRKVIAQAGGPPPTTYTAFGRSVDWNGYWAAMMKAIKDAEDNARAQEDPWEVETHGYT